ncbi:hypothetical protein B0A54_01534 [Friedmanniomyces endolithicus]|uniref:Transcription factor domain-containing protein n=1 Tax=Friedmanniomyces endolithicus TaxID=329885 RepID=A0A4U0VH19_9PEZI|nr:hypothetical protein LTS09_014199 [Friedmanniomyces endolithicus]TKA48042.1 hypothetical protein B0A54_01534 [Friedmanniomyces endolithicus]
MPNLIVMPKAFAFVSQTVNDPSKTTNADRFRIRRHVMLGLNKRVASRRSLREAARQADVSLATLTTDSGTRVPPSESTETSPDSADAEAHARRQTVRGQDGKRLGTEFETACLQLDRQIRTRSGVFASLDNTETACGELISELTAYDTAKHAAFPLKYTIDFDDAEDSCVPWIFSNMAFAHSVFFATSATNDFRLGRPYTRPTLIHLRRTIRSLNVQLGEDGGHLDDSTIYTIVTLAMLATLVGDLIAVRAHMVGLRRIIELRGGESYFVERPKQHFMLERLDLAWSAYSGAWPNYSCEPTDWRSAFTGPQAASGENNLASMVAKMVDARLSTVFQDFQRLTRLINAYANEDGRLKGDFFQHVLASIQRRLLWLRFSQVDSWSERLRLGMLAYLTTTFQLSGRKVSYDYLSARYRLSCQALGASTPPDDMRTLNAWLLFVGVLSVIEPTESWLRALWDEVTGSVRGWEDMQQQLESVLWIGNVQNEAGKSAYETLTS